jgi:hypothetical protein
MVAVYSIARRHALGVHAAIVAPCGLDLDDTGCRSDVQRLRVAGPGAASAASAIVVAPWCTLGQWLLP